MTTNNQNREFFKKQKAAKETTLLKLSNN